MQENASPEKHVVYVWDHFVSKAEARDVFIMAHSYGGLSFVELVSSSSFSFLIMCPDLPTRPQCIINIHHRIVLYTPEHWAKRHTLI